MRNRKTFADAHLLAAHLRSTEHTHHKFQCPGCLRFFNSAASVAHHVEAPSTRCTLRYRANYGQYINQLSAGLVEVDGHHSDDTVRYVISDNATEKLSAMPLERRLTLLNSREKTHEDAVKAAVKARDEYWDHHTPKSEW